MAALTAPTVSLLYQRIGRKPPRAGVAALPPPRPSLWEREYAARLRALVRAWYDHVEIEIRGELRGDRRDAFDATAKAAWKRLVEASGLERWLRLGAARGVQANAAYVERVTRIPVAQAVGGQDITEEFLRENLALVTNMVDSQVDQLADILRPAQAAGQRWEEIAPQIRERLGVSENRAKLIARDQVTKFNGIVAQTTQEAAGIRRYRWQCANDYAVRGRPGGEYERSKANHWQLNGTIQDWARPPRIPGTDTYHHPGGDIQCRCVAVPIVEGFDFAPLARNPEIAAQESEAGYRDPSVSATDRKRRGRR